MQRGPQRPGKLKGSPTHRVAVFSQFLGSFAVGQSIPKRGL